MKGLPAQELQFLPRLPHCAAGGGFHLHLTLHQLIGDTAGQLLLAFAHEGVRRRGRQIAAVAIDQQIFLLDPDRQIRQLRHALLLPNRPG